MSMEELNDVKGRQWEKWEDVDVSFLTLLIGEVVDPTLTPTSPALIQPALHGPDANNLVETFIAAGRSCTSVHLQHLPSMGGDVPGRVSERIALDVRVRPPSRTSPWFPLCVCACILLESLHPRGSCSSLCVGF